MPESDSRPESQQCPLCVPRERAEAFWIEVASLSLSTLYLDRNQTYRGQCVLVFDPRHVQGLEELTADEFRALSEDLRCAARAVATACSPDLMNYASLGNVIPHVHWHIVPRYRSDPRWGAPIYTTALQDMPETRVGAQEYQAMVEAIRSALADSA